MPKTLTHKAKKHFGQNFLINRGVVTRIVETALLTPKETVLEIGPGRGVLTEALLEKGVKVIAVEKDRDLIPYLKEKFAYAITQKKLILVNKDIRDINLKTYHLPTTYKLVANIPYYLTGEIIRTFLESRAPPQSMILMLQKEVGQRIVAKDGKESILSIAVKAYGKPSLTSYVSRGSFSPAPNVDSAIVKIEYISKDFFKGFSEKKFFEILKTGFAHKRKYLFSNLIPLVSTEKLKKAFLRAEIPQTTRPEDLSLENWGNLASSV